ncbi:uncharacterized protein LOC111638783 [Centruroides sculpturatus]|uniref:uncharacterized protein LOC111638783 n=1 Tax=Centruroides sculpturatus TaxID=218467 RepID=UPI000C6E9498|nr:uncharacterized protein LOC111638783 [Centruroides sculpturatus]
MVTLGPDIRKLISNTELLSAMNNKERDAWIAFKAIISKFLGINKNPDYKEIVENLLIKYRELGCNMSLKEHFLNLHLDYFPENLWVVSEEQGERFHQDSKEMERYQGRWDVSMMADYCSMMHRDILNAERKIRSTKHSFRGKRPELISTKAN